jgi:hypothetical protein
VTSDRGKSEDNVGADVTEGIDVDVLATGFGNKTSRRAMEISSSTLLLPQLGRKLDVEPSGNVF